MQIEMRVLNGLPVTVNFTVTEYNQVTVNWQIVAIAGKICKSVPDWIMKKLTPSAESRIDSQCFNAFYEER